MMHRLFEILSESRSHFEGQHSDESVVLLLRRHIFTVLLPFSLIVLLALTPIIIWHYFSVPITAAGLATLFFFVMSLFYLFLWAFLFYLLTIYSLNTVIVTDKRIIENEQYAFFSRKVSELHTDRVQDVSAHTHGLIETLIGFGDIVVQTAASEREFVFHRIPHPERVKDKIMQVVASRKGKTKFV